MFFCVFDFTDFEMRFLECNQLIIKRFKIFDIIRVMDERCVGARISNDGIDIANLNRRAIAPSERVI
jgi:hypothetical protein